MQLAKVHASLQSEARFDSVFPQSQECKKNSVVKKNAEVDLFKVFSSQK